MRIAHIFIRAGAFIICLAFVPLTKACSETTPNTTPRSGPPDCPRRWMLTATHRLWYHDALKVVRSGLKRILPVFPVSLVLWLTCWELCLNHRCL